MDSLVKALLVALKLNSKYTYHHSRAVAQYSMGLSHLLKLDEGHIEFIKNTALLHDIGKIGIPDSILNKPDTLTINELKIIKDHPKMGFNIIEESGSSLKKYLKPILYHHERFDGTGYPLGLKGEDIPLEARIISICDSFEAMTALRPYKKPMDYKEALKELEKNAGTQFDPYLVKLFIKYFSEIIENVDLYKYKIG
ncbi:HD-GYP domain-containing protein [Halothermothrix orenii]|uniref:Metal dependent phosphohydrolase n=1 Tax=Halothermothrix orenii (strain H 168 / OCM 544 / DSM 9562) TaxID=373903 RepID=B8CYW8_HALOH|nr:HD-GYP domain-containing protein [Halothermothrix orenii]ACL70487.1 metal dependent phosphohydrolase [Halothermothrix orenii H 168]